VRQPLKVPFAVLCTLLFAVGCGTNAESAADADSERLEVEAGEVAEEAVGQAEAPPASAPAPAPRPAPQARTPAGGTTAPPPATGSDSGVRTADPDLVTATEPPPPVREAVAIPAGARIAAVTASTISTRSSEPGEFVYARVTEEVLAADGMVLVPEGARLRGRIQEARPSSSSQEEALLVVVFETLVMDGYEFPMRTTVVETELSASAGDSGTRSAAKVATGAAAGAVIGQILGRDTRSTVQGAAAGAIAGAGVAITTRDGHAELREGSRVVIQIDEPVVLVP